MTDQSESDTEIEEDEYQPVPTTVINIKIHHRKTKEVGLYKVLLDTGTSKLLGTRESSFPKT